MTYTPIVYKWRASLVPLSQTFSAGGQSIRGGLTQGGALVENPEPGGRGVLSQSFSTFTSATQNLDASWTMSRIKNGAVMRVPIFAYSVQLVSAVALGASGALDAGIPWDNGNPWDGEYWLYDPRETVAVAALEGQTALQIDMSTFGDVLKIGHVFGLKVGDYDFAHVVMDADYSGGVTTVTVSPPLRRDIPAGTAVRFRPETMVTCQNPDEVQSLFSRGRHVQFGAAKWVEALV